MAKQWDDRDSHEQGLAVLRTIAEREAAGKHTTKETLAGELGWDIHDPDLSKTLQDLRQGGSWVEGLPIADEPPPLVDDRVEPENMTPVFELPDAGRDVLQRYDAGADSAA